MSSFYLDIIKDRQYTMPANSQARRSAQTAMYLISEAMVRWIAPVLSFTSDEIWQHLPGEHGETVFTEGWYEGLFQLSDQDMLSRDEWSLVVEARAAVSKELERLRVASDIGGSIDASVSLYADGAMYSALEKLGDELRFVLITSSASVAPLADKSANAVAIASPSGDILVDASANSDTKCTRCWHHRSDVGSNANHPLLCQRCIDNVDGEGETRKYA